MIKINFTDFWHPWCKDNNYFYNLLNSKYDVVIDEEDPDLVFFSVYGHEIDRYYTENGFRGDCKKIFYTGENCRPNFDGPLNVRSGRYVARKCDFAFTFDHSDDPRNYRLPLWSLFIDWFNQGNDPTKDPSYPVPVDRFINRNNPPKSRFCAFLYSRSAGDRCRILDTIQRYKKVDCAGKVRHNTNYWIEGGAGHVEKINFLSDCKFTIAAENSKHGGSDGYVTEKILHPLSVGSIPIYWGCDRVAEDFNEAAFINANKLSDEELFETVIRIDNDDDLYVEMINQPVFPEGEIPNFATPNSVLNFIEENILCSI